MVKIMMRTNTMVVVMMIIYWALAAYSYDINDMAPPDGTYRLSHMSSPDVADSLFTTPDSSYKPKFDNGNRAVCRGIWVAKGSPSGHVCVHPNKRSDTTARYRIWVDSTLDAGYIIPYGFDKIFKSGTTIPLDSIGYEPKSN